MKRLYVMTRIYDPTDGRLQFKSHIEARNDRALQEDYPENEYGKKGINGFANFDIEKEQPKLLLSLKKFYFLIENKDFKIDDNHIVFI